MCLFLHLILLFTGSIQHFLWIPYVQKLLWSFFLNKFNIFMLYIFAQWYKSMGINSRILHHYDFSKKNHKNIFKWLQSQKICFQSKLALSFGYTVCLSLLCSMAYLSMGHNCLYLPMLVDGVIKIKLPMSEFIQEEFW